MLLTKEQALKVDKRKFKTIDVEELGGEIRIASLSAGAGLELKRLGAEGNSNEKAPALVMFTSSIVDDKGEPLFDEAEAAKFIERISVETMGFIVKEIGLLSGGTAPSAKGSTGSEVPAGNPSVAAPSESSPTA